MTVALWVLAIWFSSSALFVTVGVWWVNRPRKQTGEPCPVLQLYPTSGRRVRAVPQKPPKGDA